MRLLLLLFCIPLSCYCTATKRALQKSHEKSQLEKWKDRFLAEIERFDQTSSLINLLNSIATTHLSGCTSVILYDRFTEDSTDLLLEKLFRTYPILYVHGQITEQYQVKVPQLLKDQVTCVNFVLFLKDVMQSMNIIGPQINNKVVVIARSSQWRVYDFLSNEKSQSFMNLLVIAVSEKVFSSKTELPYILYTHKLYTDALGSSTHSVLTSWKNDSFTRPNVALFPKKMDNFAGHRFIVSVAHQPPFTIKREKNEQGDLQWDGIEIRTIQMLARMYNFSTDYREATNAHILGSPEAVSRTVSANKANLGVAGIYVTHSRIDEVDTSVMHSQDCASFISLMSTALPRYRAIMGPFHWSVWICLVLVYVLAIFPLAFSDKHTLSHLLKRPEEVENMFWYVFGTFTNAFSFIGENSWSRSTKFATRLLIGFYWMFTIIITACYTGSIIAFVTLPVYPAAVDNPQQLISGRYEIGMLDRGGWQDWFRDSNDTITMKLLKDVDLVGDVADGLKNVTKAFFWPYAFLGSRGELDYILRTNFTMQNKRSLLHIASQCFVPFTVSIIYTKNSLYGRILDTGILKLIQGGFLNQIKRDVDWQLMRQSGSKLSTAESPYGFSVRSLSVEDRALTLDDTQGMFLLLGIGFVLGGCSLLSEWLGGCMHLCKRYRANSASTITSRNRSHDAPTPRQKLDSMQYNSDMNHSDMSEIVEERNCIVHSENTVEDMDTHIDRLFNFDDVFGEKSSENE